MVLCTLGSVVVSVMCTRMLQKAREPSGWQEWSEHAKALAALTDGQLQHPVHLFIGVIRREAQLVETGRPRGEK